MSCVCVYSVVRALHYFYQIDKRRRWHNILSEFPEVPRLQDTIFAPCTYTSHTGENYAQWFNATWMAQDKSKVLPSESVDTLDSTCGSTRNYQQQLGTHTMTWEQLQCVAANGNSTRGCPRLPRVPSNVLLRSPTTPLIETTCTREYDSYDSCSPHRTQRPYTLTADNRRLNN